MSLCDFLCMIVENSFSQLKVSILLTEERNQSGFQGTHLLLHLSVQEIGVLG